MNTLKISTIVMFTLWACGGSASATLLMYDGFVAGGAAPNAATGEYETGTGYSGDDLIGQDPTILGASGAWQNDASGYASTVYYRTENVQMNYTDGNGASLSTSTGQLNLTRTSGSSATDKNVVRDLSIGTSLPTDLYISLLVRMTDDESFTFRSASTNGVDSWRFNFGINASAKPFVTNTKVGGSGNEDVGAMTATTGETHLLVVKLHDSGIDGDVTSLYLNPLLGSEGLNSVAAEIAYGNSYVSGDASWTLKDIYLRSRVADVGSSVEIDEIRIGSTWESVTPHAIPEPSSVLLLLTGFGVLGLCRRQKLKPAV
ncbi:PEP-CTERM sorting domain-containing protein [Kiritimatiellota bacterium B12222]|nr:PEP-CTERM sorting domain-containing protein [Kiritimatiellota bacterium B12222]